MRLSSRALSAPVTLPVLGLSPLSALVIACGDSETPLSATGQFGHVYAAASVVFGEEGDTSYVSLLSNLESQEVHLDQAREIAGWAGVSANDGKLFISDGESPIMRRYGVDT